MVQRMISTESGKFNLNLETKGMGKPIAHIKSRGLKDKLYDAVFGKKTRMMIIIPESCVSNITVTPVDEPESGNGGEQI